MNAHAMSALLASLSRALQLPSFSLFILNPRRRTATHGSSASYGYRSGFSHEEMAHLRASEEGARMMATAERTLDALHARHARRFSCLLYTSPSPRDS